MTFLVGQTREFEAVRKDGSGFPCEVAVSLVKSTPPIFCGSIRDISARKQHEMEQNLLDAKIQQTQKIESLGILAGGIAHDFNNLLMGVLGYVSLALADSSSVSPVRQSLLQIEAGVKQAADLARQMLAYSGKGAFVVQEVDLSELVEEVSRLLESAISKSVVIKYSFARNLPPVTVDVVQLRQVVMNLITNASDSIGNKSGVITINTGAMMVDTKYLSETYLDEGLPDGLYVYLEVADTGVGMNQEVQAKMFDPFYSTKASSRGLGLAAVLGIVRGHGGAIKCYSEVGQGTTMKVLLPATPLAMSRWIQIS